MSILPLSIRDSMSFLSSTEMSAIAAIASAVAAAASAVAAFLSVKESNRMRQLQIEPSVSVAFDNNVGDAGLRTAVVKNESGCDIAQLSLTVSVPADVENTEAAIEASVMKMVATYDLNGWTWRHPFRRKWKPGASTHVDCESWFSPARELITSSALTAEEKAIRATVVLNVSGRRVADNRPFQNVYVYRVVLLADRHFMALPIDGNNPADTGKRLILQRETVSDGAA